MPINIPVPIETPVPLNPTFREILRRAVDGTVGPLFVGLNNLIGIGTVTPKYPLHIVGTVRIVGTAILDTLNIFNMANIRNIDCQGQATIGVLGVTNRAAIANLNAFGPSYFSGTVQTDMVYKVKEGGTAAYMGTAVLSGGAATVSTKAVAADSRIFLTSQVDGGAVGFLRVSTRTAGTSFTITSSSGTDTSTVAWIIFQPGT